MFSPVSPYNALEYSNGCWRIGMKREIFERSVALHSEHEKVFYDGPPFPTGSPHHGTVLVSVLKDMVARFLTMRGYSVPRRWGWDCHGLPIETQAEKLCGISEKTEIQQRLGIAAFNDACRAIVGNYNEAWRDYIREVGRWVDYDQRLPDDGHRLHGERAVGLSCLLRERADLSGLPGNAVLHALRNLALHLGYARVRLDTPAAGSRHRRAFQAGYSP